MYRLQGPAFFQSMRYELASTNIVALRLDGQSKLDSRDADTFIPGEGQYREEL